MKEQKHLLKEIAAGEDAIPNLKKLHLKIKKYVLDEMLKKRHFFKR